VCDALFKTELKPVKVGVRFVTPTFEEERTECWRYIQYIEEQFTCVILYACDGSASFVQN
jgi:hypothetical protein